MDRPPTRVRSSVDAVTLCGTVGLLLLLGGFGTVANETNNGANADATRAVHTLPYWITDALGVVSGVGAIAAIVALIVRMLVRAQTRLLLESLLAGAGSLIVIGLLALAVEQATGSALYAALTLVRDTGRTAPFDPFLAAWFTFITVARVGTDRVWRLLVGIAVALYALSVFAAAQATLLSLLSSAALGIALGLALRYFAGTVNDRPDGARIAVSMAAGGLAVTRLERRGVRPGEPGRSYCAQSLDGAAWLVVVLDRDQSATGWFYRTYRALRLRAEVAAAPDLSIERAAERRMLMALAGERAGAALPTFRGRALCGPDTIVLVYDRVEGTPLTELADPLTDRELAALWQSVERLHRAGVSHPRLTPSRIVLDRPSGRITLPRFDDGTALATELRISLDRAQVMASTAELVGPERAVSAARAALTEGEFLAALRVLQPVGLSRETRRWLKTHRSALDDVRAAAALSTDLPVGTDLERLERVRPRTILMLVGLVVAAALLIGQLGSVDLVTVIRRAQWQWLPLVAIGSALTYLAAGLALMGYVRERLPYLRTVVAQVAASFVGFVMPPAVGGLALNVRYLQARGLSTTASATSVATNHLGNAIVHIVLLTGFAAATGTASERHSPIPGWAFLVLAGLAGLVLLALAVPMVRKWVVAKALPPLREVLPRLLDLVTSPVRLVQALGGAVLLNGAYIATLWFAVRAFHGNIDVVAVAVVYLAGAAVGSAAPTPGGIGAVEAALSAGLVAAGLPSSAAISAVLLYRIGTFWLPVPIGWLAMRGLQRRHAL